jgi:hypothetical protein
LAHGGTTSGFKLKYQVLRFATVMTDRVAGTGNALIAAKGKRPLQRWVPIAGRATALAAGALTINLQMKMAQATTDTTTPINFTVAR